MNTITHTATIPAYRISLFEALVEKMNKKAIKNGWNTISYTFQNPQTIEGVEKVDVTYTVVATSFAGYNLVGFTNKIGGIETLDTFDESFTLSEHRGTCACDHCGIDRQRNKVYLMAKTGETDVFRVGSSCVNDFLGGDSVAALTFLSNVQTKVNEFAEEEDAPRGNRGVAMISVDKVFYQTALMIRRFGWVSSSKVKANNGEGVATKNSVIHNISAVGSEVVSHETIGVAEEIIQAEADEMKAFAIAQGKSNDYFNTVNQMIDQCYAPMVLVGYLVGVYGWLTTAKAKAMAADANTSNYIGEVGERIEFTGTVVRVHRFEGYYGSSCITTIDCDGDVVTYFNSLKSKGVEMKEGDVVTFSAAIKEHKPFRDVKQTVISRATKVKKSNQAA